jgi:hypothetical protein
MSDDAQPAIGENPFCTRRVRPGAIPFLFAGDITAETLVARLRMNDWRGQIVGPHGSGKSALLATLIPALERAGQQVLLIELHDAERSLSREFWHGPQLAAATLLIVDGYEQLGRWSRFRLKRFCRRARRRSGSQPVQDELETRPAPGATGVSPVLSADHGQNARATRSTHDELETRPAPGATGVSPVLSAEHGQNARSTPDELETRPTEARPTGLLVTAHSSVGLPELCRTAVKVELACHIAGQLQRGYPRLVTTQDVAERFPRHGGNLRELLFDLYDLYEQRQRTPS